MRTLGERSDRWRGIVIVLTVLAALGLAAGLAAAQDPEMIGRGRVTFRVYCQNCHGQTAKGNGHLAELMKLPPSDLTQISIRNGGTFPADRMLRIIDGREEVLAHGEREMPIWGQAFLERSGNEADARWKIQQLIQFLESIQEKAAATEE
jgi:mono/diheme cytochrome c family protein